MSPSSRLRWVKPSQKPAPDMLASDGPGVTKLVVSPGTPVGARTYSSEPWLGMTTRAKTGALVRQSPARMAGMRGGRRLGRGHGIAGMGAPDRRSIGHGPWRGGRQDQACEIDNKNYSQSQVPFVRFVCDVACVARIGLRLLPFIAGPRRVGRAGSRSREFGNSLTRLFVFA